jgi:hypothetical protein
MENDTEDQFDPSCEKCRSFTKGKEEKSFTYSKKKAKWICQILRKNCPLKYVIEWTRRKDRGDRKTRKKT